MRQMPIGLGLARDLAVQGRTSELHAALIDIGNLLRMHQLREEELLRELFDLFDDWG